MEFSTTFVVFIVYLMNQVDIFHNALEMTNWAAAIVATIFAFVGMISYLDGNLKTVPEIIRRYWKRVVAFLTCLFLLNACTPNSDGVKQMGIAYGASEIIKSEAAAKVANKIAEVSQSAGKQIATISGKTAKVVEKKLDKMLEEK